jgi:hypothetical protein
MPDANEKEKSGICPNCHHELHYLGKQKAYSPFWHTLPQFFCFPFQKEPLLIIVLSGLLSLTFLSHYFLALAGAILTVDLVSRYCHQIIQKSEFTLKSPPGLSAILSFINFKKSVFISALLGLTILTPLLIAQYINLIFAIFLGGLAFWFLPAIIMIKLRQEKSDSAIKITNTLKIATILEPIIRMKWAYFGLVFGLMTAFITSLILIDFSQQHLPTIITPLISAVTFSYFCLVMFSILAYILSEYKSFSTMTQPSLSQKNSNTNKVRALHEINEEKRRDADIDIALKQGNYQQLVTRLEKELNRQSFSDVRRDQLCKLLLALNDHQRLEKHAHSFLTLMLGRGNVSEAAKFIQARREYNTAFVLYDLALSKRLADAFHEHKEYPLVVWLAFKAHSRFQPEPTLAELYLKAAKTLLTKLHDKTKAREYLSYIIAHYPNQPASSSAKILLKLTQKPQSIE